MKNVKLECPELDNDVWWDVLTKCCSLENLSILEIASRFKCEMEPIDLEVAFKDLCKGTTILTLEGVFSLNGRTMLGRRLEMQVKSLRALTSCLKEQ